MLRPIDVTALFIRKICFRGGFQVVVTVAVAMLAGSASQPAFGLDGIGAATVTKLSACPVGGLSKGTCYKVVISGCAGTAKDFIATAKVNLPLDGHASKGTVFFTTGGAGNAYYDREGEFIGDTRCPGSNCGQMTVQNINAADYTTVQTNFSDPDNPRSEPVGWLTGPASDGPRALACRYATLVHTVWTDVLKSDKSRPVCATGNSSGSSAIAYALSQYGMGNSSGPGPEFAMVETTSGPPMGRIDHGCMGPAAPSLVVGCPNNSPISEDYGMVTAAAFLDPAYDGDVDPTTQTNSLDVCTVDITSRGSRADSRFHHDSVVSDDFPSPHYDTQIRVLFGSLDGGAAVSQGQEWFNTVTSSKSEACISGAGHALPHFYQAAEAIITDVTSMCR
jgi:hypothetical protein